MLKSANFLKNIHNLIAIQKRKLNYTFILWLKHLLEKKIRESGVFMPPIEYLYNYYQLQAS